ncbi:hypothetical protein [Pedobacter sp. SG908]|uniref:HNH endonuclease n=1 Tax=Pedobacter sp. SG908 TaxID=2587135 RepID=UPI001421640F|nr:hypothetical protein [Pedobacter sp. SG908]NII83159.1 5-methylcytosine-specific restriction endonuclease McrA [Pedobacter sp. SG908]
MRAVKNLDARIKTFLLTGNHIDDILTGLPPVLQAINIDFWNEIFPGADLNDLIPYFGELSKKTLENKSQDFQDNYNEIHPYVKQIKSIFDYEWLSSKETKPYNAYTLCNSLDRYTCSYCNRSYTSTVITDSGKPVVRPTLDHWFPKSEYPLLRISFFNLVPSCASCNSSVKGTINFNLTDHIHPYNDEAQSEEFEFDYAYTALNGYRISLRDTAAGTVAGSKAKNTLEAMYIDEIYNSNISELRDLLTIRKNYSASYIRIMQSLLKKNMSKSEVYRILFGVVYEQENYHKRPLSKFKKDILKKLGMLDDMP